ncbi:MAG: arsenite methyltransferase [Elusimicrobiota bacterium]
MEAKKIKDFVRKNYAKIAVNNSFCGCNTTSKSSCCSGSSISTEDISKRLGYTDKDLGSIPSGANLGLGCGNPLALAALKPGDVVLDLGSGAGFDCFLAVQRVGETGKVIGVDMTPEMIKKAEGNAKRGGVKNVEFKLGEIEKLPVEDNSIDVIISNCVINLSPDKQQVFKEAFRVLKPGGCIWVSDIVLLGKLPKVVKESMAAYASCVSGAVLKDKYLGFITSAGFVDVKVEEETTAAIKHFVGKDIEGTVASIKVYGLKQRK